MYNGETSESFTWQYIQLDWHNHNEMNIVRYKCSCSTEMKLS